MLPPYVASQVQTLTVYIQSYRFIMSVRSLVVMSYFPFLAPKGSNECVQFRHVTDLSSNLANEDLAISLKH